MFLSNLTAVSLISPIGNSSFIAGTLILQDDKTRRAGLMSELSLECNTCHESSPLSTSKSVTQRGTSYDINRRAVYHAIETGSGYEGLAAFCSIMNMPCLTKAAYYKQVENILEALENERCFSADGGRMKQLALQPIRIMTAYQKSFLKCFTLLL